MKKNVLLAVCILFGQLLSAGKVFVELDPAASQNRIMPSGSTNGGLLEKRGSLLILRDDKEAAKTWKQYVFSFIPEKSGYIGLALSADGSAPAGKKAWIDYDGLHATGASIENASFEILNHKKEFFRWRYYARGSVQVNQNDAADGRNYMRVCRSKPARQSIYVHAGKVVTLRFSARCGGAAPLPAENYASDLTAPAAGQQELAPVKGLRMRIALRGYPFLQIPMNKLSGSGNLVIRHVPVNGKINTSVIYASSKEAMTRKWQQFTVSFVPELTGQISLSFGADRTIDSKAHWLFFDRFEAEGTKILNPSFERVQAGVIARWSGGPEHLRQNLADAVDGKNAAAADYLRNVTQQISVVKGRPVTIRFCCRLGDVTDYGSWGLREPSRKTPVHPKEYYSVYNKFVKFLPLKDKGIPGKSIKPTLTWIEPDAPAQPVFEHPESSKMGSSAGQHIVFELLEEDGVARTAFIKYGFLFPQGGIYGVNHLAVLSPSGKAVPAQFTAISRWADGSIKSVLTEFQADLKANERSNWKLAIGSAQKTPVPTKLRWHENADGFTVDTGRLRAVIDRKNFNLLSQIKVDGKAAGSFAPDGLVLTGEHNKKFSSADLPLKKLYAENSGPFALTLRAEGELPEQMGRFTVRMVFRAGSPVVDFSIRYQNINLKHEFTDFRSWQTAFIPAVPAKTLTAEGISCQRIFQRNDEMLQIDSRQFYRKMSGAGAAGNISYALRDAAYRYPKAFSVKDGKINFELLPVQPDVKFGSDLPWHVRFPFCEGCYRMKWGTGFTDELTIDFSGRASASELAAKQVVPVVDAAWLYRTKIFVGIPNGKDNAFFEVDKKLQLSFRDHMKLKAEQREYGFMNFGDSFGERGRNWTNNEYDLAYGLFMLYLRTGDRDAYRWAMTAARHQADVDIVHAYPDPVYIGANIPHSIGHTGHSGSGSTPGPWSISYYGAGYKGDNGHSWCDGMTQAWLLGGDPIAMEAALMLANHMVNYTAPLRWRLTTHERTAGWQLPALCAVYRVTGDRKYLDAAKMLVDLILEEQKLDLGGAWPHHLPEDHAGGHKNTYGNCPYLIGVLLHGLYQYQRECPTPEVARSIAAASGWLSRGFDRNRIGWPYGMGYDGKYYHLAGQSLNLLVAPGMVAGGRISGNAEDYEKAMLILSCAAVSGLGNSGKSLAINLCMVPVLFEEMTRFRAGNPQLPRFILESPLFVKHVDGKINTHLRMRAPRKMGFEVLAPHGSSIRVFRKAGGSNPNPEKQFSFRVLDEKQRVIYSLCDKIRVSGEWQVKLPAKGKYTVEIEDDYIGFWDVFSDSCRVLGQLRKGYHFVNHGLSRQYLVIPAGTREFTLEFFGTHEGGCAAFLLEQNGKLAGFNNVITIGDPRLPWFSHKDVQPTAKIHVKMTPPYDRERVYKLIFFAGGDVRMDVHGCKAYTALTEK